MVERRTVLQVGGVLAAGGMVAACGGGSGAADASTPGGAIGNGSGGTIAATADVPVGGGFVDDRVAVVVTQPVAGTFKAFTAVCPHQGCLVSKVKDNEIICPCHGSKFSSEDGSVIQGPATEPLAAADVAVQGDNVVLL